MKTPWISTSGARIGLIVLILSLGLVVIATQGEHLVVADQLDGLVQVTDNVLQDIETLRWFLPIPVSDILGVLASIVLFALLMGLYLVHFRPRSLYQPRSFWLLALLLLIFFGAAWVMVTEQNLLSYLFPMATISIMVAVLLGAHLSILLTALMALMLGYLAGGSLEVTVYAMLGGLMGVLSIGRVKRPNRLLWSGAYVALSNVLVILIFYLPDTPSTELFRLMAVGIANGVITATLTIIGFFLVGNLLGIVTSVRLLDLTQAAHPLLRQLVLYAPGTYHHSLMVSNLAEQAAEQIGADALLTRVGAYYHDIGKLQSPQLFTENQSYGINVHDELDPRTSAQAIIRHVEDGLRLAKKYRLPHEVRAFIAEHHGTGIVESFYHQALKQATEPEQVNEADFRYPGTKPRTKETAIVMLADSCEAAVRAKNPASIEELDQLVHHIIIDKVSSGQLDGCDLTLHELELTHNTFVEILQGAFHQRVEYEQAVNKEEVAIATPPLSPARSPSPLVTTPPSS